MKKMKTNKKHDKDCNHAHEHEHNHSHEHSHNTKLLFIMYLVGLLVFLSTFLITKNEGALKIIKISLYYVALFLSGFHVIFEGIEDTIKNTIKHKKPMLNVHILMTLSAVGAIIIGSYNEAVLLIIIFAGAHFLEDFAQEKSTKETEKLLNLKETTARLILSDGSLEIVPSSFLKIGDKVRVLNGDEIPSDGIIISGSSEINEANITGESIPKYKTVGDQVFGSTINGNDILTLEINKNSDETIIAKIIKMVSETQNDLTKTAKIIKKIEPIYVLSVVIFAPIFYLIGHYLIGWENAFYRTMVLLIGASPCALAVTDIPATLSSISNLAKNGVLFKGGSYLANMADLDIVAFDKTGTLTKGTPSLVDKIFVRENDLYIDILTSMEQKSNHPLAKAVLESYPLYNELNLEVNNIVGVGLESTFNNNTYKIVKPSYLKEINKEYNAIINTLASEGKTVVLFLENNNLIMILAFIDLIKETSKNAIYALNNLNIKTVMITGDQEKTAKNIADSLNISEVYSNVLPDEKANIIQKLKGENKVVAMLGDGINDAPALKLADVSFAMGDGTDIAIDVADAVLIENDLEKFVYTFSVAKKLKKIVIENIIFSMLVVLFLLTMNILGLMEMPLAVVIHEGSTVVVIVNGLRMLKKLK